MPFDNRKTFPRRCGYPVAIRLIVVLTLVLSVCAPLASADVIEMDYSFAAPTVENVKIDGQVFDRVILPGAPSTGQIGHPALPVYGAHILLPYGSEVTNIEITSGEKILIGSGYSIEPVDRPYVLSAADDLPPIFADPDVYSRDLPVPAERFDEVGIQSLHGYRVLILRLHPVELIPASGMLSYYASLSVSVTTKTSESSRGVLRTIPSDRADVAVKIDNPTALSTYDVAAKAGGRGYDMLILTSSELASAFLPLKAYHDTTGTLTEIRTLADVGGNDTHLIRDYIRQEYVDNGIQYVLLGGDDDVIPSLKLYVVSWPSAGAVTEYGMPGDFYFSCLDGTFNFDNDDRWGEPTDGEGGGDVDMFPEVHVGRVSANTPQEVTNLVNKTLAYAAAEGQYLEKVLLAGEQLTFGGWGEYGGYAMDEMVDYSEGGGFQTYAFPSDVYGIEKLYDYTNLPTNYWPGSEMINRINSGYHIIDHLGHSGPGYAMRTDTFMLRTQLTNTEYCFIYAEGCSAGQFDQTDCWAEHVTTTLANGAFGCVANARLGLGSRSTSHPVHIFDREFWDAVYRAEEAKPQLGRAISDARADHVYHVDYPAIRWTLYEITLFGDPALAIKSVRSVALSFPDGVPEMIHPYTEETFTVLVAGIGEGVPLSGSGQLHCTVDGGDTETTPMVEISPNLYEATLPSVPCGASVAFCVSVEESAGGRHYTPDAGSPIAVAPVSDSTVLFVDDFESDLGWAISGGLWQRGLPTGQGGTDLQYPVPDPTEGCNGPNVFGYNLDGDYENNLPAAYITSPAIDCSDRDVVVLKFCRWLGVEQPRYDEASIMVSNDHITWTQVWMNYATIGDLAWEPMEYDISAVAADQPTVYLRWVMGPTDGALAFNGWNIDDVRVIAYECDVYISGDANGDEEVNVGDAVFVINYAFKGGPAPDPVETGDANCDGEVNVGDAVYLINYAFKGGPDPCYP